MLYANKCTEDMDPVVVEKMRRNALIELLKFMCSMEFKARDVSNMNA